MKGGKSTNSKENVVIHDIVDIDSYDYISENVAKKSSLISPDKF